MHLNLKFNAVGLISSFFKRLLFLYFSIKFHQVNLMRLYVLRRLIPKNVFKLSPNVVLITNKFLLLNFSLLSPTNRGGIPTLRRTSNRTRPTSSDPCIVSIALMIDYDLFDQTDHSNRGLISITL